MVELFFKVWRNIVINQNIWKSLKLNNQDLNNFEKRYNYYQINNFDKLIKHNKQLLADKIIRNQILDFNVLHIKSGEIWGVVFETFNTQQDLNFVDIESFYKSLFENYKYYFSMDGSNMDLMVLKAIVNDCPSVLKVLIQHYKYNKIKKSIPNAIRCSSIKVLEFLIGYNEEIADEIRELSNKIWKQLYDISDKHIGNISKNVEKIYNMANSNNKNMKLNSPRTNIKPPIFTIKIKELTLGSLFDISYIYSYINYPTFPKWVELDQWKLQFTNQQLKQCIQDIPSPFDNIIKEMVFPIIPFTGSMIRFNSIFAEIKYNCKLNEAAHQDLHSSISESFSLGDFNLIKQMCLDENIFAKLRGEPKIFRYCQNDIEKQRIFVKESIKYSCENVENIFSLSFLSLFGLFRIYTKYSNVEHVCTMLQLLSDFNIPTSKFIEGKTIFGFIGESTDIFDVVYKEIKGTPFFNFTTFLNRSSIKLLNHYKLKYSQDYQSFISKVDNYSLEEQTKINELTLFVYNDFHHFKEYLSKRNFIFEHGLNPMGRRNFDISKDFPLWIFKKHLSSIVSSCSNLHFRIESFEIIDWLLNEQQDGIELKSKIQFTIENDKILKYNYYKNQIISNVSLITTGERGQFDYYHNSDRDIVFTIIQRGDLDCLKHILDESVKKMDGNLKKLKSNIIYYIIKTNRLELIQFIFQNYCNSNQFNLLDFKNLNYYQKQHSEVYSFIDNKLK